ncbi:DUF4240 domain-containing protein [Streptomyces sp. NPDC020983]|uniref:DUF4240 domain-containing protein n=1 Tax=Streptomyces sp. NPDC020983 TaxID=3365106 RepID=UPI0037A6A449
MNTESFWAVLEESRQHGSGGDRRDAWLRDSLARRTGDEIVAFQACLDELTDLALTWDLWAAADRIFGGWCSDDTFRSFQHWMMGLGRSVFEAAVNDPDVLGYAAEVLRLAGRPRAAWPAAERPAWTFLDTVGLTAYEVATGPSGDFGDSFYAAVRAARCRPPALDGARPAAGGRGPGTPPVPADGPGPSGRRWSALDEAEAARRLPRLSVLFPLGEPFPLGPPGGAGGHPSP